MMRIISVCLIACVLVWPVVVRADACADCQVLCQDAVGAAQAASDARAHRTEVESSQDQTPELVAQAKHDSDVAEASALEKRAAALQAATALRATDSKADDLCGKNCMVLLGVISH